MFQILSFIFPFLFLFMLYTIITNLVKTSNERKAYSNMIANLCDNTVLLYISAFQDLNGWYHNYMEQQNHSAYESRLRQAQGWEIVNESANVSAQVKEQLRNAFISKGVPLKSREIINK